VGRYTCSREVVGLLVAGGRERCCRTSSPSPRVSELTFATAELANKRLDRRTTVASRPTCSGRQPLNRRSLDGSRSGGHPGFK